jgi:hypothetical protein
MVINRQFETFNSRERYAEELGIKQTRVSEIMRRMRQCRTGRLGSQVAVSIQVLATSVSGTHWVESWM